MTKRFTIIYNEHSEMMQYVDNQKEEPNRWAIWNVRKTARELNKLNDENEQLKQEVELLREGIEAYDNIIPIYLTYREVRDFKSDLSEFKIKQQKFYNEHPNLCKIIIDDKEQI